MKQFIMRLICFMLEHDLHLSRYVNQDINRVKCRRCNKVFAMHHPTQSLIEWDDDLEALHSSEGPLSKGWEL